MFFFFFNDTATTEISTLSLHDALPILHVPATLFRGGALLPELAARADVAVRGAAVLAFGPPLFAQDQTGRSRGAAPQRLHKRRRRGELIQRRAGAGVQPPGGRDRPLPPGERGELRRPDGRGPPRFAVLTARKPHRAGRGDRGRR